MTFRFNHHIRQFLLTVLLACTLVLPQTNITKAATSDSLPFIVL